MTRFLLRLITSAAFVSSLSFGYYHFVHYGSGGGPYSAIPEKFDLNALPDNTVTYHISEGEPSSYAATDNFALVVGQIRGAARVWSDVETSELRLRFGGLYSRGTVDGAATPSIEVVFEDLPPGVNGYGGPTVRNEVSSGGFVPIQRSVVILNKNLSERPSWSEQFFGTAVHEFGHALGLQHSFVSGAMATEVTRATTKIRPILPDDAVGLSLLYPTRTFLEGLGSISGRVATSSNEPVAMASVVAIIPGGVAIGAITHPDGTYKIEGLPPGQYYLYAHALPQAASVESTPGNVVLPVDTGGRTISGGPLFDTSFYPASRTPFITVPVRAANVSEGINFTVSTRSTPVPLGSVSTYSFPGQIAVRPAHVYSAGARNFVVMAGTGIMQNGQPASNLQVGSIGGSVSVVPGGLKAYTADYLQTEFQFGQLTGAGPVHLVFTRGNDLYVLPYGLRIANSAPPRIESISSLNENGDVVVSGSGLQASTRIAFDGAYAAFKSFDESSGRMTVTPPPAAPGTRSHVTAFAGDGQSSLFVQQPFAWTYEGGAGLAIASDIPLVMSTTVFPAGTELAVEFSGPSFVEGQTSVGFGTPDIVVRKMWFPAPNRMVANLLISPSAAPNNYNVTLLNGIRLSPYAASVQVNASRTPWISLSQSPVIAGTPASLHVNGLSFSSSSAIQLTINDGAIPVTGVEGSNVYFTVPTNFPAGLGLIKLQVGAEVVMPLAASITPPPAMISSVMAGFGTLITPERPARYGELNSLTITGIPESVVPAGSQPRIAMTIGGVEHRPVTVSASGGVVTVQFTVQTLVQQGLQPLNVTVEGIGVQPYELPVRAF